MKVDVSQMVAKTVCAFKHVVLYRYSTAAVFKASKCLGDLPTHPRSTLTVLARFTRGHEGGCGKSSQMQEPQDVEIESLSSPYSSQSASQQFCEKVGKCS